MPVVITTVVGAVGIIFANLLANWNAREKAKADADASRLGYYDAVDALTTAVASVGSSLAAKLKEASADGKLTAEEITMLRNQAATEAMGIATGPGLAYITTVGTGALTTLINSIVQGKKAESAQPTTSTTDAALKELTQ